jgi:acetyl-CoA carboxylase biotin carboxylase subunit
MSHSISKILVANRGEIALRIMRSAREMGIKTVAIYSEADAGAPHMHYADEAMCVGGPQPSESYLNMDSIINTCKATQASAVHPGYGFLSENAAFAQKVKDAGFIFIGPNSKAIQLMGDKLSSKESAKSFDVPLVPGMEEPVSNVDTARAFATKIGYPVMVKASAGGGGKGMRVVQNESEFEENVNRAMSEALNAFGDGSVFVEKFVSNPKHIEVQILGDHHGNYIHLFERECSVQRRNQKVVEEAPSAVLSPEQRESIGQAAINVARSCGYYGAGTVEFIVDEQFNFYFLEMNTRLQVEHPVTEMITGVDLVKEQIRIAQGEKLRIDQADLSIRGHSIEIRVYAENPYEDFVPDTGTLQRYERPSGPGIRVDDGYVEGMEIPIYYDPMISKLISYGADRDEAIQRMNRAIDEYIVTGVETTLPFGRFAINHPSFRDGSFNTNFVSKFFNAEHLKPTFDQQEKEIAALCSGLWTANENTKPVFGSRTVKSTWKKRVRSNNG